MNRNRRGDEVGNPRRLLLVLSILAMAGVIGVVVLAAIWPGDGASTDSSDLNTEASAPTAAPASETADHARVIATGPAIVTVATVPAGIATPDPTKTPGDILSVAAAQVCVSGYAKSVRNVSTEEKRQVYASYGIKTHTAGQYEVDHLIPLGLGGSNDIKNLWPEPAEPRPGFHEKDMLEYTLHQLVCDGRLALTDAQKAIATDWYGAYLHFVLGK